MFRIKLNHSLYSFYRRTVIWNQTLVASKSPHYCYCLLFLIIVIVCACFNHVCLFRYNYDFTVKIITAGKYPVKVCGLCKKEGHSRSNCPDEMIKQQLPPLPPLTPSHAATLDRISERMFGEYFVDIITIEFDCDDIIASLLCFSSSQDF